MNPKLLVVLAVVLLLLYGGALGVLANPKTATAKDPGDWLKGLETRVVLKRALDTKDINPDPGEECGALLAAGSHELNSSSPCVFTIKEAADRPRFLTHVRTLTLRQISGVVTMTYVPDAADQLPANPELCENWTTLQVFEEGGELTITCGSAPCQIEVSEQAVSGPGCEPEER